MLSLSHPRGSWVMKNWIIAVFKWRLIRFEFKKTLFLGPEEKASGLLKWGNLTGTEGCYTRRCKGTAVLSVWNGLVIANHFLLLGKPDGLKLHVFLELLKGLFLFKRDLDQKLLLWKNDSSGRIIFLNNVVFVCCFFKEGALRKSKFIQVFWTMEWMLIR